MKKYDSYKDSGVEWIGEIPSHWKIMRGKEVLKFINGYPFNSNLFSMDENEGFPLVRIRDLKSEKLTTFYKGEIVKEVIIDDNDFIIGMDGDFNIIKWNKSKALLNQRLCKIEGINELQTNYLSHSLPFYLKIINDLTYFTTVKHLSNNDLFEQKFVVPPSIEQTAISNYLDHKTIKIDHLIAKKEQFIQLLEEERVAVINQAVTKGLEPNVPMKDSGIEWLGQIPKHWEVNKLKYLLKSIQGGGTPSTENDDYWNGNIPWVSPKDMKVRYIDSTKDYINQEAIQNSSAQLIMPGRLLMVVRSGILKHTLPLAINITEVSVNQDLKAIEVNDKIDTNFLYWLLYGKQDIVLTLCSKMGATVDSIDMEVFMNHKISIPPFSEQLKIVEYIEFKLEKIRSTNNCLSKEIKLLKEYKTALISEVVTGKVDVRNEKLN
jgi:type I restriction enzyme S subunit